MSEVAATSPSDPDADATVREFIDYTEYLPSDISRYHWRIRDLHTRYDESRAQLDEHLEVFAKLGIPRKVGKIPSADTDTSTLNGVNGLQRVVDSVSDKEMELRFLISQCLNDTSLSAKESAVEAQRLQDHVQRHHSRIVAIRGKLDTITIPSRDPTPEERKPKPKAEDSRVRITLRLNNVDSASPQPPPSTARRRGTLLGRTPGRRAPKVPVVPTATEEEDEEGWEDVPETPLAALANKPRKKKGFALKPLKRGPKLPPADPLLSGGAPARTPDGTLIPNEKLPWNQLTNEELARLRKRMKKNSAWTPSVTMIVRELEALGRGPNNRDNFREQWEGKPETLIGPEEGGIGDPHKILPDDGAGARENKGMRLNRAKKRKREEEKKERAREAERSGLDPIENERKVQEEEQERQRKELQAKRRKKKEEEEAARLAKEKAAAEAAAAEKAAREAAEREAAEAAKAAKAKAEAEAKAKAEAAAAAAKEKAEKERLEKLAKEKAAQEAAAAEAARLAAEAAAAEAAKKQQQEQQIKPPPPPPPPESDDELSDVPDFPNHHSNNNSSEVSLRHKPPSRTSKRNPARPHSRPPPIPRGVSATPSRPKRGSVATPPPLPVAGLRKRSASVTSSSRAAAGKKPTATSKRPSAGARRKKRGKGGEVVNAGDESEEDLNKYCLCNEVSRGTMVACENDDCPKVWFHITCVGLTKDQAEDEELKWYCPYCEETQNGWRPAKRRRKN